MFKNSLNKPFLKIFFFSQTPMDNCSSVSSFKSAVLTPPAHPDHARGLLERQQSAFALPPSARQEVVEVDAASPPQLSVGAGMFRSRRRRRNMDSPQASPTEKVEQEEDPEEQQKEEEEEKEKEKAKEEQKVKDAPTEPTQLGAFFGGGKWRSLGFTDDESRIVEKAMEKMAALSAPVPTQPAVFAEEEEKVEEKEKPKKQSGTKRRRNGDAVEACKRVPLGDVKQSNNKSNDPATQVAKKRKKGYVLHTLYCSYSPHTNLPFRQIPGSRDPSRVNATPLQTKLTSGSLVMHTKTEFAHGGRYWNPSSLLEWSSVSSRNAPMEVEMSG